MKKEPFPSIWQCFWYIGILILMMIPASLFSLVLNYFFDVKITVIIITVFLQIISFLIFNKIRRSISGSSKFYYYNLSFKYLTFWFITTIIYIGGFVSLFTEMIPINDSIREQFVLIGSNNLFLGFWSIVVFAPIFEELIFRGIMLDGLLQKYKPAKSIIISSFIFAIIHINPKQVVNAFLIGLFLGWSYYKTRNILIPIFIHSVNNLIAFIWMNILKNGIQQQSIAETFNGISNYIILLITTFMVFLGFFHLLRKFLEKKGEFNWEILKHNKQEIL
jgi:membrane protease YdiL (CAAX protease family)